MALTVRPLTYDLLSDWLFFFDHRAFTDNPFWRSCYCTYYQLRGEMKEQFKPVDSGVKVTNRDAASEMIKAGIIKGYLCYRDDQVIGWMNANDKILFPTLRATESAGEVLAVMCFVIAPGERSQGIATGLLTHCIADARQRGFKIIEGRASLTVTSTAGLHHGPRGLYEKLGFDPAGKRRNQMIYRYSL